MVRGVLSSLTSLSVVLEKIEASVSFSIGVTKFPHTDKLKEERWCLWLGFQHLWLVRTWMSNKVQAMVNKEAEGKTQEIISNKTHFLKASRNSSKVLPDGGKAVFI